MIEVGEYGRTNKGKIFIFSWVVDDKGQKTNHILKFVNGGPVKYYLDKGEEIVKHSKNIIDLIDVGDILEIEKQKYEVIYDESFEKLGVLIPNRKKLAIRHSSLEFIFQKYTSITILTKEQYEANCYKVKEKI